MSTERSHLDGRGQGQRNRLLGQSVLATFLGQAFLLISGVLAARLLGPAGRGDLALLMLIPIVAAHVSTLGIPQALTYFIASDPSSVKEVLVRSRWIVLIPILLTSCGYLLAVNEIFDEASLSVAIVASFALIVIPASAIHQINLAVLQGFGRFLQFDVLRQMPAFLYLLALVLCQFLGINDYATVTQFWILSNVATAILGLLILLPTFRELPRKPVLVGIPNANEILRFGLRGFFGRVSPFDTFRLDHFIVGLWFSPAVFGLYVVGQSFANLPRFIAQGVGAVAFSQIRRNFRSDGTTHEPWQYITRGSIVIGAIVAPLYLCVDWLVPFFFGKEFVDAIDISKLLILAGGISAVRMVIVESMRGLGAPGISSIGEITAMLSFLTFIPWAIHVEDVVLVAQILLISQGIALSAAIVLSIRTVTERRRMRI